MQAYYSGYVNTGKMKPLKGGRVNYASQGSFERSERRNYEGAGNAKKKKNKKRGAVDIFFMILTVILLIALFPVGLILLWTKKFKAGAGVKILLTIAGAVVFLALLAAATKIKTDNPKIKSVQDKVDGAFVWVYNKTGAGVDVVLDLSKEQVSAFGGKAAAMWDEIEEDVARKTLDVLGETADNVSFYKEELPGMLLDKYVEVRGYNEPEEDIHLPEKQSEEGIVLIVTPTPEPTPEPTETPEPTATPEPTPEPTKEPIILPPIKDVADAPVYFTANGTFYHCIKNCTGMQNAVSHTLREAKNEGKKYCNNCSPISFATMENRDLRYLWVDNQNVAHTSDECLEFAVGGYRIMLFDEVYSGHYSYCPSCKAEVVYDYMAQNDKSFNVNIEEADAETQLLYRAEEAVTVYYGTNSRYYHANRECQQMTDHRYDHNLFEALHRDGMKPCQSCNPDNEGDVLEKLKKKK